MDASLRNLKRRSNGAAKTKAASQRVSEEEMYCGICSSAFELPRRPIKEDDADFSHCPKILDCLHRFCQSCIQEAVEKIPPPAFFGCPTCQKRQAISDVNNGASKLATDYTILKEIKRRQLDQYAVPCDECNDEVPAGYRCEQCGGIALCTFHMEAHQKSRALKSHTVDSLEKYAAKREIKKRAMAVPISKCWKLYHQELPFDYFCQECEVLCCERCRAEEHSNHSCAMVDQVATTSREQLKTSLEGMESSFDGIKDTINELASSMNKVTANTEDLRKIIHRCFADLHKDLDKREKAVIEELERLQENKLESLSRKRALLDQGLSDLETSCELADRSVYGLSNSDFMALYKPIWKRIQATSLQLRELDQFDSRDETRQVTFGYSLRDRDLLSEGISKFGGLLQEGDEAEEEEESKNKKLTAAASSKQAAVKPLVPTIEFIILSKALQRHRKNGASGKGRGKEGGRKGGAGRSSKSSLDDADENVVIEVRGIPSSSLFLNEKGQLGPAKAESKLDHHHSSNVAEVNNSSSSGSKGDGADAMNGSTNTSTTLTNLNALAAGVRQQGPLLGKVLLAIRMEARCSSSLLQSTSKGGGGGGEKGYAMSQFFESLEEEGDHRPILRITKSIKFTASSS